jgi:hypothetical protein
MAESYQLRSAPAAVGFRVHSGWAALVVVSGSPGAPAVLDRRRIEIADPSIRGSVQPYHRAAILGLSKAQAFLDECAKASRAMATAALREVLSEVMRETRIECCAMLLSSGRPGGSLESILASHAAIHTAEGDFFRDSIVSAVSACKLPCRKIREKELLTLAETTFQMDVGRQTDEMRKMLGAPWTQDQKFAAIAGWISLAAR